MLRHKIILLLLAVSILQSCGALSGKRIRNLAEKQNFTYQIVKANGFSHAVFKNPHFDDNSDVLHVYLEGDGVPWLFRTKVSSDPTGWNPLMLKLMSKDSSPSLYVGRPCYNGFSKEQNCSPMLWTMNRHSERVVDSMVDVVRQINLRKQPFKRLHLYGHSGGGAMAMLMAAKLKQVNRIVTIAGNLDLTAWTSHHQYSALVGSLNPAEQIALGRDVKQLHLLGGEDKNIPPDLVLNWINLQKNTMYFSFPEYSHNCCWPEIWPKILNYVNTPE